MSGGYEASAVRFRRSAGEGSPTVGLLAPAAARPQAGARDDLRRFPQDLPARDGTKVALIGNQADTLIRFRGPLIHEMARRGMRVFALVPGYTARDRAEVRALGAEPVEISLQRANVYPWRNIRELIQLQGILRGLQPDVVFAFFLKPSIHGSLAAHLAGVPRRYSLIEGMGYAFADDEDASSARRRFLRWFVTGLCRLSLPRADRVFVLNRDDEALLVRHRMVKAENIICLPGIGVDLDDFPLAPEATSPITFLLMARLIAEKGIREYAAAARLVKARYPNVRFVLLGGLDQNPGSLAEAEVSRWVDEGTIEWPGQVKDVRPWIRETSVYALPSYYREGLPRSILEAMAMGRPIITTDSPGCRETMMDGENGFLVPVRDPHALAETMIRFVERPDLIRRMGRVSRRLAEDRYDVHKVNATLLETMGLGGGDRGGGPGGSGPDTALGASDDGRRGERAVPPGTAY